MLTNFFFSVAFNMFKTACFGFTLFSTAADIYYGQHVLNVEPKKIGNIVQYKWVFV